MQRVTGAGRCAARSKHTITALILFRTIALFTLTLLTALTLLNYATHAANCIGWAGVAALVSGPGARLSGLCDERMGIRMHA